VPTDEDEGRAVGSTRSTSPEGPTRWSTPTLDSTSPGPFAFTFHPDRPFRPVARACSRAGGRHRGCTVSSTRSAASRAAYNGKTDFDICDNPNVTNQDFVSISILKSAFSTTGSLEGYSRNNPNLDVEHGHTGNTSSVFNAGGGPLNLVISVQTAASSVEPPCTRPNPLLFTGGNRLVYQRSVTGGHNPLPTQTEVGRCRWRSRVRCRRTVHERIENCRHDPTRYERPDRLATAPS
jgi:hypothetical protein